MVPGPFPCRHHPPRILASDTEHVAYPLLTVEDLAMVSVVVTRAGAALVAGVGVLLALLPFSSVASVCSLPVLLVLFSW